MQVVNLDQTKKQLGLVVEVPMPTSLLGSTGAQKFVGEQVRTAILYLINEGFLPNEAAIEDGWMTSVAGVSTINS